MKPLPGPRIPTGLSERCRDALGKPLVIRCERGFGWSRFLRGEKTFVDDDALCSAHVQAVPERFIDFIAPRGGIYGSVLTSPPGYSFKRFVALTMSDGCDWDFTEHIASAWRVMLGDGEVDYESEWFPFLNGEDVYFGYGVVGLNEHYLNLRFGAEANLVLHRIVASAPGSTIRVPRRGHRR
jgi:mannose-6-phosphate isomerase-like protein (cupin superfamily)